MDSFSKRVVGLAFRCGRGSGFSIGVLGVAFKRHSFPRANTFYKVTLFLAFDGRAIPRLE